MPALREVGEFEAIRRLAAARAGEGDAAHGVMIGSGDDAAVLRASEDCDLVATTDAFVEGRHYEPAFFDARAIGRRLALANLSDLAAMAAAPRWALLSIGARPEHDLDALIETQAGLGATLAEEGAAIVGGNLTGVSGAEWFDLTLLGETPRGRAWTRRGARRGDRIAITGFPGRAGAGAALAKRLGDRAHAPQWAPLIDAWRQPHPRVALALALAPLGAVHAAIDLSDGLAGDLRHVCEASGVGAEIDLAQWPPDAELERAATELGRDHDALRFGPSDDYELLLAIDPARVAECEGAAVGTRLRVIGRFVDEAWGIVITAPDGRSQRLDATGFDHFRAV